MARSQAAGRWDTSNDDSMSTPLVHHISEFVSQAKQCVGVIQGPALNTLVDYSKRTVHFYGWHARKSLKTPWNDSKQATNTGISANSTREPLLRVALKCLEEALNEAEEEMRSIDEENGNVHSNMWEDDGDPSNGVMHMETTKAFHRLFSALLFEFCDVSRSPIQSATDPDSLDLQAASCGAY